MNKDRIHVIVKNALNEMEELEEQLEVSEDRATQVFILGQIVGVSARMQRQLTEQVES